MHSYNRQSPNFRTVISHITITTISISLYHLVYSIIWSASDIHAQLHFAFLHLVFRSRHLPWGTAGSKGSRECRLVTSGWRLLWRNSSTTFPNNFSSSSCLLGQISVMINISAIQLKGLRNIYSTRYNSSYIFLFLIFFAITNAFLMKLSWRQNKLFSP